ncbi:helix-turn-helix domain-containing protein, partial [Serratia marcescens]|uniref:helix-turn-helix domain-containing protein n=1 Tax=Serratia marcescens TaxID=615 RepID=UPI000AFA023F
RHRSVATAAHELALSPSALSHALARLRDAIGDALLHPGDATFGPKVEAVIVYNSNPVAVAPDSSKVAAGFARDDLFTVVLEHFKTDTVDFADIVLPATTQLEHLDIHKSYGHTYVMANLPSIPP